ncbi:MAG: hypothetical protein ACD_51C00028G0039 [uncultured bacterium]|nr:MAG: hypothetical protein ACD_51C00028G0039 [uncultured bacterium]
MKKKSQKIDLDLLKHWKRVSTKGKLDWLESALYFGKMKRFSHDKRK